MYESTVEREMEMLRSILTGKMEASPEHRTKFLQDFAIMRSRTEETIQWLLGAYAKMKQVSRKISLVV